ncbi:MAG: hypothetical protein JSR73_19105 [Proteobacteria bacterium]|nr:hypothetical protein [Pseudomonadota bacterium]
MAEPVLASRTPFAVGVATDRRDRCDRRSGHRHRAGALRGDGTPRSR